MIFGIQIGILLALYTYLFSGQINEYKKPTVEVMIMRLLCSYLFHMTTYGDGVDSWQRLKFLKNNPDLFESQNLMVVLIIPLY